VCELLLDQWDFLERAFHSCLQLLDRYCVGGKSSSLVSSFSLIIFDCLYELVLILGDASVFICEEVYFCFEIEPEAGFCFQFFSFIFELFC